MKVFKCIVPVPGTFKSELVDVVRVSEVDDLIQGCRDLMSEFDLKGIKADQKNIGLKHPRFIRAKNYWIGVATANHSAAHRVEMLLDAFRKGKLKS